MNTKSKPKTRAITGIFFLLLCLIFNSHLHAQEFEWVKTMSTYNSGSTSVDDIEIDNEGYLYIVGHFEDSIDIDPGPAVYMLRTSGVSESIFLAKMTSDAKLLWARTFISNKNLSYKSRIELDSQNNIYLSSQFNGAIDLDLGLNFIYSNGWGKSDIFLAKYDSSGGFMWGQNIGESNSNVQISDLSVDSGDNPIIAGLFTGSLNVTPGTSQDILTSNGSNDAFVIRYNSNGLFSWGHSFGAGSADRIRTITCGRNGEIYLGGYFSGTVDFDPGLGIYNRTSTGFGSGFLLSLDTSGTLNWVDIFGGSGLIDFQKILLPNDGSIVLAGNFSATIDFDPTAGVLESKVGSNRKETFVLKLNSNHSPIWLKHFKAYTYSNNFTQFSEGIILDGSRILLAGELFDSTIFGIGSNSVSLGPSKATSHGFWILLDSIGKLEWAGELVNTNLTKLGISPISSLAINQKNEIYSVGYFDALTDFDPAPDADSLVSPKHSGGWNDLFIHKMSSCTAPGLPTLSLSSATVCGGDSISLNITGTWNSATYWALSSDSCSGPQIAQSAANNLSFYPDHTGDYYVRAYGNCVVVGDCEPISVTVNSVDTMVNLTGFTLSSNAVGATYQWIDCDNGNLAVVGATNSSFTPGPGNRDVNYAVIITQNGCSDTSSCYFVPIVGLEDEMESQLKVYPNPTSGLLNISFRNDFQKGQINVFDLRGKLLRSLNLSHVDTERISLEGISQGIYLLEVILDGERIVVRVMLK